MTVCYLGGRDDVVSCRLNPIKPACSDIGCLRTTSCCVNRRVGYSDVERSLNIRTASIDSASNGGCSHIVVIAVTLGIYGCITDTDASHCSYTGGSDSGSIITHTRKTFASRRQGDIADSDVPARVVRAIGSGIASYSCTTCTACGCQHIIAVAPRDSHGTALCYIDACAISGGHAVLAQHMDGGAGIARDADGITTSYADVGILQINCRIVAGDGDGLPEATAHPVIPIAIDLQ